MSKTTVLIPFDLKDPDLSRIREIARGCREGKVVAFPTETVYGIGGPMSLPEMASKIAEIKNRSADKPFAYHIGDWAMVEQLQVERTPAFKYLTRLFWPGPMTLLVKNASGEKIGLRFPRHYLTTTLINTVGEPFIGTSANKSGQPSPRSSDEVLKQLEGEIDYLMDGGPCEEGQDSTIVDLTGDKPMLIREGAGADKIKKALEKIESGKFTRKNILVVCTGNSCRSPMAEGWLKAELRRHQLGGEISVISCGVAGRKGMPATPEAILVMKNREIDISEHRSLPCTRELVLNADVIFAMSHDHYSFMTGLVPSVKDRIHMLDIPDPIGMGLMLYEEVIKSIETKMKDVWADIIA